MNEQPIDWNVFYLLCSAQVFFSDKQNWCSGAWHRADYACCSLGYGVMQFYSGGALKNDRLEVEEYNVHLHKAATELGYGNAICLNDSGGWEKTKEMIDLALENFIHGHH